MCLLLVFLIFLEKPVIVAVFDHAIFEHVGTPSALSDQDVSIAVECWMLVLFVLPVLPVLHQCVVPYLKIGKIQVALEIPASPSAPPSFVALDTLPKLSSSSVILLFDTSSDLRRSVKLINLWEHLNLMV